MIGAQGRVSPLSRASSSESSLTRWLRYSRSSTPKRTSFFSRSRSSVCSKSITSHL